MQDDDWMAHAACRGEETIIFFPVAPSHGKSVDYEPARAVCRACPVRARCLAYAIAHDESWGIWGGYNKYERKRIPARMRKKIRDAWWRAYPGSHRSFRTNVGRG